jgi:beta-galactosidase
VNCRSIERQVEILKTMGVNSIRLSHNPHAPELYEVADRLGVFLMDESFDTWTGTKTEGDYGNFFSEWAETDIKDMVQRDRNHPSVFAYSIGDEIYGSLANVAQNLVNWVKEEDDTRLTTWGSNNMETSSTYPPHRLRRGGRLRGGRLPHRAQQSSGADQRGG